MPSTDFFPTMVAMLEDNMIQVSDRDLVRFKKQGFPEDWIRELIAYEAESAWHYFHQINKPLPEQTA